MSHTPDRVAADLRAFEHEQDELERKYRFAEDEARKLLNEGAFDSDTIKEAMASKDSDWWRTLEEQIQNDFRAAGLKLREAVYEELVRQNLEDQ